MKEKTTEEKLAWHEGYMEGFKDGLNFEKHVKYTNPTDGMLSKITCPKCYCVIYPNHPHNCFIGTAC